MAANELRAIFDEDADLYDRARPGYPDLLFSDLRELADVGPGARVAEIGPGTGQATTALVAGGAYVVAVELGAALAARLRRKLAGSSVEVVVSAFEDWVPPQEPFDTLAAFTSWHWLDPAVRAGKAAAVLRPGGALATVTTTHVLGGTEAFFVDAQNCYERWDPSTPSGLRLSAADSVPFAVDEIDGSALFPTVLRRQYQQDVAYSRRAYVELLGTYSGHRALPPDRQRGLLACIAALIDDTYGGTITKRFLYELRLARRGAA